MNREMGLANFWAQGDAITHTVAIVLLLLSVHLSLLVQVVLQKHYDHSRKILGLQQLGMERVHTAALGHKLITRY